MAIELRTVRPLRLNHPNLVTQATPRAAIAMLILAAAFWGSGNVANKTLLADIGPLTALALRAIIAAAIMLALLPLDRAATRQTGFMSSALLVSGLFVFAAAFQQAAFQWTTVTNASFLVNTCTVLTPLLAWVLLRQRPNGHIIAAALITLCGAWLMCGSVALAIALNPGDAACLVSALFYAGWALALGRHAVRYGRPMTTVLVQLVITAVVLAPVALAIESPTLVGAVAAGPEVLFLAVFSTAGACVLTTIAQRQISPSVTVVLLSLESVFGAVAAFVILGERSSMAILAGGALILVAVIVATRR